MSRPRVMPTVQTPRHRAIFSAVAATVALVLLTVSRDLSLPPLGSFLITADPLRPADAIVPLAGERSRVDDAAGLFGGGYARWYIITEMWVPNPNPDIGYVESVRGQTIRAGVPADRILVAPGKAASTYREALNLRRMLQEHHVRSLIVVTSPFHTRRSRLILNDVFRDTGTALIIRPVREHWFRAGGWWVSQEGRQVTAEEYLKLALYLVGYHSLVDR